MDNPWLDFQPKKIVLKAFLKFGLSIIFDFKLARNSKLDYEKAAGSKSKIYTSIACVVSSLWLTAVSKKACQNSGRVFFLGAHLCDGITTDSYNLYIR